MIYKRHSPAQSTTSLSDNDDDDVNKSIFFNSESLVVSPAQWSSRLRHLRALPTIRPASHSPMSHLPTEILIHVLRHLHSPRDLYNALRVSRSWCECSVELLWHRPSLSKVPTLVKMMQILSRPDQTFTYARFIRRLNFLFLGGELTDSLFSRLAQCDRLERLTLVNCAAISDEPLARVLPCLPNLVAIDLTGVIECTDKAIVGLASAAKRLQGINLGGCRKVSDRGILALANRCPLLRRVKLSGVELITDDSVSALAQSCPLLLEIDLNLCKRITDKSVRDIWLYSTHMREMRLAQCIELTDAAFPAPPRPDAPTPPANNPFPASTAMLTDELPPLVLTRPFDHLRMLDLTACSLITDDAVEGIVAHAPKIRNLVFSKCAKLTDRTVENICRLGKHLHYLHLGHAAEITDSSVRTLARCCTRLRYVDFANCVRLTDMSVFELSSLPKLRRIGLVRVHSLTDAAIYSLADRHATLERIHLSYCEQISVMAIHFLLGKLHKLTHLSLTGVSEFRTPELQQFCRQPPQEFNTSQRNAFCVYSGKGVSELRLFLTERFNTMTENMNQDDDTEYDEEYEDIAETTPEVEMETSNEGDDEGYDRSQANVNHSHPHSTLNSIGFQRRSARGIMNTSHHPEGVIERDRTIRAPSQASTVVSPDPRPLNGRLNGQIIAGPGSSSSRRTTMRAFGQQPVVETSTSPTPSDVPSTRSAGTSQSNGAFFRTYQEAASSSRSNGAQTPDLIFAEIGHGRGISNTASQQMNSLTQGQTRRGIDTSPPFNATAGPFSQNTPQVVHSSGSQIDIRNSLGHDRAQVLNDSSNSYRRSSDALVSWPRVQREYVSPSPSSSPTTRDLHESVQSISSQDNRDVTEGRGRRVKRSLRNTISAAENYASSFLFGRGGSNGTPEGNAGWSSGGMDNGSQGR